jgi:hypothetical protein
MVEAVVVGKAVVGTSVEVVIGRLVVSAAVLELLDEVLVVVTTGPPSLVANQMPTATSTTALPPRSNRERRVARGESSGCGGPDTWGLYAATETECRNMRKPRP